MKIKNLILFMCLSILLIFSFASCKKNDLIKIRVAEVAHSVFYAPQYVAIHQKFFEEEGLEIELINANGADKVTAAILSKDVEIGLQGPEPTIYLYNNDQKNYLVNFLQLTQTDGSFIFGREKIENFDLSMLKGKTILGGRKGGVPEMSLEYILKEAGLTVLQDAKNVDASKNEVSVRTDVQFQAMAGAFLAGEGDFVTLFEPTATSISTSENVYLLSSVGKFLGKVPYTAYSTSKKYFDENKDILEKFTRAIYKGQQFVQNNTDKEVAKVIKKSFIDIDEKTLESVVKRYREIDAWCSGPYFEEAGFNKLMDILERANELEKRVPFSSLVNNEIANLVLYGNKTK